MKSNFIKYLLTAFILATALTSQVTEARPFLWKSWSYWPCSTYYNSHLTSNPWTFYEVDSDYSTVNNLNYYDNYFYYTKNSWNSISSWNLLTYNNWDRFNCHYYRYESYSNNHIDSNYNFIKVFKDSSIADFYVWRDDIKSYRHVSTPSLWYSEVIDWEDVLFNNWFPRHWTIIFYSSDTKHTIQIIWDKTLYDLVVYIDPKSSYHNLYVINYYKSKAWSMRLDDINQLSSYMFWWWSSNDTFFNNLEDLLTESYTIKTGWTYWRPQTDWQWKYNYYSSSDWYHYFETETANFWLVNAYVSDFDFQKPDFWFLNNVESDFNDSNYSDFIDCKDKYNNISQWANSEYLCRQDLINHNITTWYYENLFSAIYNFSWVESIQAMTRNCQNWLDYSVMAFYDSVIWNENLELYQSNFLLADRNSRELNMLNIDNYCTYKTPISTGLSSQSSLLMCLACNIWFYSDLYCDEYCNFDIWWNQTTDKEVDSVIVSTQKTVAKPFFLVFDKIEDAFYSWYNEVKGIAWYDLSCDNNVYWKSYYWWNIAVIWILAWLVFIFIWLL